MRTCIATSLATVPVKIRSRVVGVGQVRLRIGMAWMLSKLDGDGVECAVVSNHVAFWWQKETMPVLQRCRLREALSPGGLSIDRFDQTSSALRRAEGSLGDRTVLVRDGQRTQWVVGVTKERRV